MRLWWRGRREPLYRHALAERLGLQPEFITLPGTCAQTGLPNAWRHGVPAERIAERARDRATYACPCSKQSFKSTSK